MYVEVVSREKMLSAKMKLVPLFPRLLKSNEPVFKRGKIPPIHIFAVFGFLVPYFDLLRIRFGTPPWARVSTDTSPTMINEHHLLDPTILEPNGISRPDNPDSFHP
jgi:hypothetical protein